MAIDFS